MGDEPRRSGRARRSTARDDEVRSDALHLRHGRRPRGHDEVARQNREQARVEVPRPTPCLFVVAWLCALWL